MKKKTFVLSLAVFGLALVSCGEGPQEPDKPFSFERINYDLKEGVDPDELQGAPWINSNLSGMTAKIEKPSEKDDFYASVNYDALCANEPGPFNIGNEKSEEQAHHIIHDETDAPNSQFIRKAYELSNTDVTGEVKTMLDSYLSTDLIYNSIQFPNTCPFFSFRGDGENTYIFEYGDGYVQGEVGLPTLFYYGVYYEEYLDITKYFVSLLSDAFEFTISDEQFQKVCELEQTIADEVYKGAYLFGIKYTSYTFEELEEKYSEMIPAITTVIGEEVAEDAVFKVSNLTEAAYKLVQESYASEEGKLTLQYAQMLRTAFDYRTLMGLDRYSIMSYYLSQIYVFRDTNLYGVPTDLAREYLVRYMIFHIVEKAQVTLYGSEEVKQMITNTIEDAIDGYIELADEIEWISDKTRNGIKKKLEHMTYKSCYSDIIKNYPAIDETNLDSFTFFDIHEKYQDLISQLKLNNTYEDGYVWQHYSSRVVNAFYFQQLNEFAILNGMATAYDYYNSTEELYAMIGVVIGHEISHAFDENGADFDENGNYKNWWASADKKVFTGKVNEVKKFFKQINLFDDEYVDGDNVCSEAIADMGGVKVMLTLAKKVENFDYDKFFRKFAFFWLENWFSEEEVARQLKDTHPFSYLRVNVTVAQFDEFVETYHLKSGDGMYIPKDQRIAIW